MVKLNLEASFIDDTHGNWFNNTKNGNKNQEKHQKGLRYKSLRCNKTSKEVISLS